MLLLINVYFLWPVLADICYMLNVIVIVMILFLTISTFVEMITPKMSSTYLKTHYHWQVVKFYFILI